MSIPRSIEKSCEIVRCANETDWLLKRQQRIQATDTAEVVDGSALKIFTDKTLPVEMVRESIERFDIAHALQPVVAKLYQKKYGGKVHEWDEFTIAASRQYPFLGATPDALVEDPERDGLGAQEIKTWSPYDRRSWDGGPPLRIQIQVQHQMLVLGLSWGVIPVMFGNDSLERFFVDRNDTFIDAILPVLQDFWTLVESRVAPPADGSEATTRALAKLHPNDNGKAVRLSAEFDQRIERMKRLKTLAKKVKGYVDGFENELKAAIGDNTYGVTPAGEWVSWKSQHRDSYTVAESDFRVLRPNIKEPHGFIEYADAPAAEIDFKIAKRKQLPLEWKVRMLAWYPRCKWCGCQLTLGTATFDHVVPLAVGGSNKQNNIALACRKCNEERGCDATLPTSIKVDVCESGPKVDTTVGGFIELTRGEVNHG